MFTATSGGFVEFDTKSNANDALIISGIWFQGSIFKRIPRTIRAVIVWKSIE